MHAIINIYLILLFLGVLLILLRLHDIKLLIRTFIDSARVLSKYINRLEEELRKDEDMTEYRVNKLHVDIMKILDKMKEDEEKRKNPWHFAWYMLLYSILNR